MDETLIIVAILYLIPLIKLIQYYSTIKLDEYLLLGGLFLLLSANSFTIALFGTGNFVEVSTSIASNIMLVLIFKDFLENRGKNLFWAILLTQVVLASANLGLFLNNTPTIDLIRGLLYNIMRFLTASYILIIYSRIVLIVENDRTIRVKRIWQFAAIILLIIASIRFGVLSLALLVDLSIIESFANLDQLLTISSLLITIGSAIISISAGFVAWNYPEFFLLTRSQINYVYQLYNITTKNEKEEFLESIDTDEIITYLDEITELYKRKDE